MASHRRLANGALPLAAAHPGRRHLHRRPRLEPPEYVLPAVSAALGFLVAVLGGIGLSLIDSDSRSDALNGPDRVRNAGTGSKAADTVLGNLATELGPSGVVPTGGTGRDEDGRATATVRLHPGPGQGRVCFAMSWRNLDPPVAAEIRSGVIGANGPLVATLFEGELPVALHTVTGCAPVRDRSVIDALRSRTADHHLTLRTTAHPGGAIRGQLLSLNRPPDLLEALRGPLIVRADGAQETGDPVDPRARATGFLRVRGSDLAFLVTWEHLAAPASGRIHLGPAGRRGPVAAVLFDSSARLPPTLSGVGGTAVDVEPVLLERLRTGPARFYLRVHDPDAPRAAVRGQVVPSDSTASTTASGRSPGT